MASTIRITQGSTSPPVTDTLQSAGVPINLTGATVRFQMRKENSAVNAVDSSASIISAVAGTVSYAWGSSDTANEGVYQAWWKATLSGGLVFQSPEFLIYVDAHGPGDSSQLGEIATQARQLMPVTWDALSTSPMYGDYMLSGRTSYVKYKLFATVVAPLVEASVYNPMVLDYAAKETALQVIPAGIDFWMNSKLSIETERENITYPDRIEGLKRLQEWLLAEVARLRVDLNDQFVVRRKGHYPKVGNGNDLITPNPQEFGKPYGEGYPTNLPWGPFS